MTIQPAAASAGRADKVNRRSPFRASAIGGADFAGRRTKIFTGDAGG
jgi:hypothetical protein